MRIVWNPFFASVVSFERELFEMLKKMNTELMKINIDVTLENVATAANQ